MLWCLSVEQPELGRILDELLHLVGLSYSHFITATAGSLQSSSTSYSLQETIPTCTVVQQGDHPQRPFLSCLFACLRFQPQVVYTLPANTCSPSVLFTRRLPPYPPAFSSFLLLSVSVFLLGSPFFFPSDAAVASRRTVDRRTDVDDLADCSALASCCWLCWLSIARRSLRLGSSRSYQTNVAGVRWYV